MKTPIEVARDFAFAATELMKRSGPASSAFAHEIMAVRIADKDTQRLAELYAAEAIGCIGTVAQDEMSALEAKLQPAEM